MKIAITADRDDVNGLVPKFFADAAILMIIDGDTNVMEAVYEKDDPENIHFAEQVLEHDCEVLICGQMEKEAFEMVAVAQITRFDGSTRRVQKAYDLFKRGQLTNIRDHIGGTGEGHSHDHACHDDDEEDEELPDVAAADRIFDAVITAAGLSSRMGDFKPLMELGGEKVILREIRTYLAAGVRRVILVCGSRREELEAEVRKHWQADRVLVAENPDYASTDMLESARLGIYAALIGEASQPDGIFLSPVDVPLFTVFTLNTLKDWFGMTLEKVYIPCCRGKGGHPVLLRSDGADLLMEGDESRGLKSVLEQEGLTVRRVDVPDRGMTLDADTPEEFAALERELDLRREPDEELCRIIQEWCGVSPELAAHCRKVADTADEICRQCGTSAGLNPGRIHGAALLHDVLKGMKNHENKGREFLEELDMAEVGALVGAHGDWKAGEQPVVDDRLVVFLADKLVSGDRRIPLRQRFDEKRKLFGGNPYAMTALEKREAEAMRAYDLAVQAGWKDEMR